MPDQDGLVPVRARGDDVDRGARDLRETLDVAPRVERQLLVSGQARRRLRPAGQFLVDGDATLHRIRAEGQDVDPLAVQLVGDADAYRGHAVEHVELRQAKAVDAVQLDRALERGGIEPAAAARPAGDRA